MTSGVLKKLCEDCSVVCQAIWSLSFLEMENRIKVLLPPFLNFFFF